MLSFINKILLRSAENQAYNNAYFEESIKLAKIQAITDARKQYEDDNQLTYTPSKPKTYTYIKDGRQYTSQ